MDPSKADAICCRTLGCHKNYVRALMNALIGLGSALLAMTDLTSALRPAWGVFLNVPGARVPPAAVTQMSLLCFLYGKKQRCFPYVDVRVWQ